MVEHRLTWLNSFIGVKLARLVEDVFISGGRRWKRVQSLNQTSNLCLVVVAVKDCLHLAPPPHHASPTS